MTLRYGVIGFGLFGRLHAQCIENAPGAELVAIAARAEESAKAAREAHPQARLYRDHRELLSDPAVDAVSIVTANHTHAAIAIEALEAGRHVLLEKPMATSREDCDRVIEAERRSGRLLSVGFELRLSVQWSRIKQLIDEAEIGRVRYVNVSLFRHPYRQGSDGWRYDPVRVGSWILEEPVHYYDLAMWYMAGLGNPVAVSARGTPAGERAMYDNFSSVLTFESGAYVTITQSLAGFGHHLAVEIAGEKGAIRSTWSGADARSTAPSFDLFVRRAGRETHETVPLEKPSGEIFELQEEIRLVTEAFAAGRTLVPAEEGRKAVIVCLEAERAVRQGSEVALRF
jgi:myo-inositol 2-dehydrogenase / D-chiro-inositol 1-dehydrogenase